jgi:hypothetical protein
MNKKLISHFYIFLLLLVAVPSFLTPTSLKARWCATPGAPGTITPTGTWTYVAVSSGDQRAYRFIATAACTFGFSSFTT